MKKRLAIMLAVVIALTCSFTTVSFAATNPEVSINGLLVLWTDASPFIDSNGRTLVPFRATMEECGLYVSWDAKNRIASVTDGSTTVEVPIDSRTIYINGRAKTIDTNAVIKGGRTYLPIRAVAEAFGYKVCWSSELNQVTLIKLIDGLGFEMIYRGESLGEMYVDTDGVVYINWYDGTKTIAEPTAMYIYDGEYIIQSNEVDFVINYEGTSRVYTNEGIIYLYS